MKKNAVVIFLFLCLSASVAGCLFWVNAQPKTVDRIVIEAGSAMPPPEAFLLIPESGAVYTVLSPAPGAIGELPVEIAVGSHVYTSALKIVDTIPPHALPANHSVFCGDVLAPEEFVREVTDATAVSASYLTPPDFNTPGRSTVTIKLRDEGGNEAEINAQLMVYAVKTVELEAGMSAEGLRPVDFVKDYTGFGLSFASDMKAINYSETGKYAVKIKLGNSVTDAELHIIDTIAPKAEIVHVEGWVGDSFEAEGFLTNISDLSPTSAEFAEPPDFEKQGKQDIKIQLTDASGNSSEFTSTLRLTPDRKAPVIAGDLHKRIFIGDSVAYRAGITVTDNRDDNVPLNVDSSAVNIYAEGVYTVRYSATDRRGNKADAKGSVTVYAASEEQVYEMADAVLAKITTDEMSLEEKAKSIYDWVRTNVKYVNSGEKDSVIFGAYRALQKHSGDCYTFYAISEVLLTRAGIPNIGLTRVGGRSKHFWQIIDVGTGWHHFDTTPHQVYIYTFLFTESQAEEYTKRLAKTPNYYVYDKTLYPEVMP